MDGMRKWNERSLKGADYPFLQADALVIRVRENHKVVKKVIQLAIRVSEARYREVLGIRVARQENEVSWTEFFTWLNRRGLGGVDYVTSDNHEGLNMALGKTLPHVVGSRCQTHFSRNLLEEVHKKDRQRVHAMLKIHVRRTDKEKGPGSCRRAHGLSGGALSQGHGYFGQCQRRHPGRLRSPGELPEEDADREHDGADQRGGPEAGTGDPNLHEGCLGDDAGGSVSSGTQ